MAGDELPKASHQRCRKRAFGRRLGERGRRVRAPPAFRREL